MKARQGVFAKARETAEFTDKPLEYRLLPRLLLMLATPIWQGTQIKARIAKHLVFRRRNGLASKAMHFRKLLLYRTAAKPMAFCEQ